MNHYDDRASYFAMLNDQREYLDMQDANNQADISCTAYGGTGKVVKAADMQADV